MLDAIGYASAACDLGIVLVAGTRAGLQSIDIGDDEPSLLGGLRRVRAALRPDPELTGLLAQVLAIVEAPGRDHQIPLDPGGTEFQRAVWRQLRRIPSGRTVTYVELARRLGRPSAARAVAGACGRNPLAVAIPCHRVLASDGGLAGYRWGLARKRALLAREAAQGEMFASGQIDR